MAEKNLSTLSSEDINRFNKTVSMLDDVIGRQEEILKKVLEREIEIGETRLGQLEIYFNTYSKKLDSIAYSKKLDLIAKKTSKLNEAFLIFEQLADKKALENFTPSPESKPAKKNSSKTPVDKKNSSRTPIEESIEDSADNQTPTTVKKKKPKKNSPKKNSNNVSEEGGGTDGGSIPPPPPPSGNNNTSNNNTSDDSDDSVDVAQYADDEAINKLTEITFENLKEKADEWSRFFQKNKTPEERSNVIESNKDYRDAIEARRIARKEEQLKKHADTVAKFEQSIMDLEILRHETSEDLEARTTEIRLSSLQESLDAEIAAAEYLNNYKANLNYSEQYSEEAGEARARKSNAEDTQKTLQQLEEQRLKWIAKKELESKRKNNNILKKEEAARIQKEAAAKFKIDEENLKKLNKKRAALEDAMAAKEERAKLRSLTNQVSHGETTTERYEALKQLTTDEAGAFDLQKTMTAAVLAVSDLAKQLEGTIDEIAGKKGVIDTRLQGSSSKKFAGSYWDQLVRDMTSVGAVNPFFRQKDFASNIEQLVNKGIAFDLKQRAFLMTIHEKIANTFNAADGTLLRLIRIQQEDSTAGRLGMESALNAFLNEMYETSEYLSDVASSVRSSLEEMESLMKGAEATEVEFQVQKWLGSLYSVGMSQNAVQGIANAIGQVAAGQIEGLTSGGAGNLLIMAANDAGLSIADILTDGINASDTNKLLQATVNYLAELAESAKDNKVVQQQLADVFGVKASDLRAATNLVLPGSTNAVFNKNLTYNNMLNQLSSMAGSMINRTSVAEIMTNIWENGKYTLAGSMASNPVSYFIYKMAKVLDDAAGGIDLPFLNVMGFGVDLNTTVSDLMRIAAVGSGILGSIGPMVQGLGSSFSGRAMLNKLGIGAGSSLAVTPRGGGGSGGGGSGATAGASVSESGYVGNASGSDIKDSTIQESKDSKKQQMIEAKEEEEPNQVNVLNDTVIKIYELLDDVVHGSSTFRVKVEGYGLTKASNSASALGGVEGLSALDASSGGGGGGSSSSNRSISGSGGSLGSSGGSLAGGGSSGGVGGNVTLGGWTSM